MRDGGVTDVRRALAMDGLIAAVIAAILLANCVAVLPVVSFGNQSQRNGQEFDVPMLALAFVSAVSLVARRRAPIAVLVISGLSSCVYLALGYAPCRPLAPAVALLTVALSASAAVTAVAGVALALCLNVAVVIPLGWWQEDLDDRVLDNVLLVALACLLGWGVQLGRARTAAVRDQAATVSLERTAQERALQRERSRIARELHDVVAHHVSVITAQAAGAQRVFDTQPDLARQALDAIETTGRGALIEMRRILGLLQPPTGEATLDPQPTLDQLPALVARIERAGLPVRLSISGSPSKLPPGMELNAFRIVQESLTNTFKHAGATHAEVELNYGAESLRIRVSDDGRGLEPDPTPGRGLIGMRERAALHGGALAVRAGPDGGVEVVADLPLELPDEPFAGVSAWSSADDTRDHEPSASS